MVLGLKWTPFSPFLALPAPALTTGFTHQDQRCRHAESAKRDVCTEMVLIANGNRQELWDQFLEKFTILHGLPPSPPEMNRQAFLTQYRRHLISITRTKAMHPREEARWGPRMRDPLVWHSNIRILRAELHRILFTTVNFDQYLTRRRSLFTPTLFTTIFGVRPIAVRRRNIRRRYKFPIARFMCGSSATCAPRPVAQQGKKILWDRRSHTYDHCLPSMGSLFRKRARGSGNALNGHTRGGAIKLSKKVQRIAVTSVFASVAISSHPQDMSSVASHVLTMGPFKTGAWPTYLSIQIGRAMMNDNGKFRATAGGWHSLPAPPSSLFDRARALSTSPGGRMPITAVLAPNVYELFNPPQPERLSVDHPSLTVMSERGSAALRRDSLQRLIVIDNAEEFEEAARHGRHDDWLFHFFEYWFQRWSPPRSALRGFERNGALERYIAQERVVIRAFWKRVEYSTGFEYRRLVSWGRQVDTVFQQWLAANSGSN
ncbi:hypothetical protein DFP72DRAFT_860364 [Ephemerocybe angulata]|uniref:Uncharacterized protein n=1 Tax=Ephemerocybe angulata TaxID=980116 RepID=A0A8H6H9V9_9AGAR|nr:hypothetical protein DFP72DRAFT_860364 [Tulosesus angulatus]